MILEAILLLAILATSFIVCLDKVMYPRHSRLFRGKPKLVIFSQSILPVLLIIFCLRSFTFEIFRIPSGSMKPTLIEGDLVLVDKYSFGLRVPILGYRLTPGKPQRGDIAVFRGELEGKTVGLIKRIVGLPGDHIQYVDRVLYVNGKAAKQLDLSKDIERQADGKEIKVIRAVEELGTLQHSILMSAKNNDADFPYADLIVPQNSYYVMGDYRSNSQDSRYWGVLQDTKLIGKARLIAFSFDWQHKFAWPNQSIRWSRIGTLH